VNVIDILQQHLLNTWHSVDQCIRLLISYCKGV